MDEKARIYGYTSVGMPARYPSTDVRVNGYRAPRKKYLYTYRFTNLLVPNICHNFIEIYRRKENTTKQKRFPMTEVNADAAAGCGGEHLSNQPEIGKL